MNEYTCKDISCLGKVIEIILKSNALLFTILTSGRWARKIICYIFDSMCFIFVLRCSLIHAKHAHHTLMELVSVIHYPHKLA